MNQSMCLGAQFFDHGLRAAMAEGRPLSSIEDLSVAVADNRGAFGAADVQAEKKLGGTVIGHWGEFTNDWARAENSGVSHHPPR